MPPITEDQLATGAAGSGADPLSWAPSGAGIGSGSGIWAKHLPSLGLGFLFYRKRGLASLDLKVPWLCDYSDLCLGIQRSLTSLL